MLNAQDLREPKEDDVRRQPFALFIRSSGSGQFLLLHGVSPVGNVSTDGLRAVEIVKLSSQLSRAKLCEVPGSEFETYTLTVEGDIIFDPQFTQVEEVIDLLNRITIAADWTERCWLEGLDQPFSTFRKDLFREARRATD